MNTKEDVEKLEKVIGQLQGAHSEITILSKKAPSDSLNTFKLKLINKVIETANEVLGESYKPFVNFDKFDADDVPTTSDVTMVLSQYMEEAERYRSDNVTIHGVQWYYDIDGGELRIRSGPPSKIGKK